MRNGIFMGPHGWYSEDTQLGFDWGYDHPLDLKTLSLSSDKGLLAMLPNPAMVHDFQWIRGSNWSVDRPNHNFGSTCHAAFVAKIPCFALNKTPCLRKSTRGLTFQKIILSLGAVRNSMIRTFVQHWVRGSTLPLTVKLNLDHYHHHSDPIHASTLFLQNIVVGWR